MCHFVAYIYCSIRKLKWPKLPLGGGGGGGGGEQGLQPSQGLILALFA